MEDEKPKIVKKKKIMDFKTVEKKRILRRY